MKISLFYKPSITRVSFLFVIISLTIFSPFSASANTLTDWLFGKDASAEIVQDNSNNSSNLQNMDLYNSEPSLNPDHKNINDLDNKVIVQSDSLVYSDGFLMPDVNVEKSPLSDQISVYTVENGDTLSEIADSFNVSTNTIRWENNITGETIKVGQKLNILPITGVKHIVKSGDTVSKIADKYDAEASDILIFNGISEGDSLNKGDIIFVPNGIIKPVIVVVSKSTKSSSSSSSLISNTKVQSGYYIRPASGSVTSPYGPRKGGFHPGVDIGNVRGTPIYAAANGIVIAAVSGCAEGNRRCGGGYGNHIDILHSNGNLTRYGHLSKVLITVGQEVDQGQQIGLMGNTGYSTGPHLHFEVRNSNGSTMRPPVN